MARTRAPPLGYGKLSDVGRDWAEKYQQLAERLAEVRAIKASAPSRDGEGPEWTLAHALADIEEACAEYPAALQKILGASTPEEVTDALLEVVEVLGHMSYHLADPPYLRQLLEQRLAVVKDLETLEEHS